MSEDQGLALGSADEAEGQKAGKAAGTTIATGVPLTVKVYP